MLEQLFIQNYQTHDKFRIDFDTKITSIIGPSDAGKSAVIRALRWVCTNRPNGDSFVRHNTKGSTVRLVIDGHTVTRRRSSGGRINEYQLDDQKFVAFGNNVPEPIEKFLNIGSVSWQGQHDPAFWFTSTPGEVSRQLNAIVNLGVIDETLTGVGRAVTRARTKLEIAEEDLTEAKAEYDALAWVQDFTTDLEIVNDAETHFNDTAHRAATGRSLVQDVVRHKGTAERAATATLCGGILVETGKYAIDIQNKVKKLNDLINTARRYEKAAKASIPDIDKIEKAYTHYITIAARGKGLFDLTENIRRKETELCHLEKKLKIAKKAIPKQCPTCGQSL